MTERANACGHEIAGDWFVFTNQADGTVPWFPASVSRSFKRLCDREGVDVRTVAGRLGHRNAATTLNVYAHFLELADRGAADLLGAIIAPNPDRGTSA